MIVVPFGEFQVEGKACIARVGMEAKSRLFEANNTYVEILYKLIALIQ